MLTRTYPDNEVFIKRREQLRKLVNGEAALILFSGQEGGYISRFRAESSFVYLTGFEEPNSCAVLRFGAEPSYTLFVPDKDPAIEIWDGERYGHELAKKEFVPDSCFPYSQLRSLLPNLLRGADSLYYSLKDANEDRLVLEARQQAQVLDRRSGRELAGLLDPKALLGALRVIKDQQEIQWMQESCDLSARAHQAVMRAARPGINERALMGCFLNSIYSQGAMQEGYSSIVASGPNATTLHYRANNREIQKGDFLLIDAGAEKNYYTADITRTYPVGAPFSSAQKDLYQAVLYVQKDLIKKVKVGFSLPELHQISCQMLTEKMVDLGLLTGKLSELVEKSAYSKYYPHGVGHFLGMDVHDVGRSKINDKPRPFEESMVITVEPGLYVPDDDISAPKELRGLGVRIEDDILIQKQGSIVLSRLAPKEITELESIVGQNSTS